MGLTKSEQLSRRLSCLLHGPPHTPHSRQRFVASKTLPCTPSPGNLLCLNNVCPLLVPVFPGRIPARGQLSPPRRKAASSGAYTGERLERWGWAPGAAECPSRIL